MIAAPLNVPAEVGAVVVEATDAERAGFVNLPGIAAQAFRWPSVLAKATVYRARCGTRPAFQSAEDALAYEHGFRNAWADHAPGTPAARGAADWHAGEFERRQQERDDERAERGHERMVYGSDE